MNKDDQCWYFVFPNDNKFDLIYSYPGGASAPNRNPYHVVGSVFVTLHGGLADIRLFKTADEY